MLSFSIIISFSLAGWDEKAHPTCLWIYRTLRVGRIPRDPPRITLSEVYITLTRCIESNLQRFCRIHDSFICSIYLGNLHFSGVKHSAGMYLLETITTAASPGNMETLNLTCRWQKNRQLLLLPRPPQMVLRSWLLGTDDAVCERKATVI